MKVTIKFLTLSCIVLALCFASCSKGEDGIDGEQGIQGITGGNGANGTEGTDGTNGTEGTNGINGTNGNADVHSLTFDASELSSAFYYFSNVEGFTVSTLENDLILYYLRVDELYYPIPGLGKNSTYKATVYTFNPFGLDEFGAFEIRFMNPDGAGLYATVAGQVDEIHVIIIKSTSSSSKSSSPLAELNSASVDVKDYNAVMKYYGLNN